MKLLGSAQTGALAILASTVLLPVTHALDFPSCADKCLAVSIANSTCSASDYGCLCSDPTWIQTITVCAAIECPIVDLLRIQNATTTGCGDVPRSKANITPLVTVVSGLLALLLVILRVVEKVYRAGLQWSDFCAVAAMAWALTMCVFEFLMTASGFGRDIWTLSQDSINKIVLYTWVTEFCYIPAIGLTKIAILLWYLTVFPIRSIRLASSLAIAWCVMVMLATFFVTVFSCHPIKYTWVGWAGEIEGQCILINEFWYSQAAINIVTDLAVMVIPIPMVFQLQLSMRKKIYLSCMFCFGLLITIFSVVRFSGLVVYSGTSNPTYNNVGAATWSVLEAHVSIICCCMPYALPLLTRTFGTVFNSTTKGSSGIPRDLNSPGSELVTFGQGTNRDKKSRRRTHIDSLMRTQGTRLDDADRGDFNLDHDHGIRPDLQRSGGRVTHVRGGGGTPRSSGQGRSEGVRQDFESDDTILPTKTVEFGVTYQDRKPAV